MKKFKTLDVWISIVLIIGFLAFGLIKLDETFIYGYYVVGGWQLISMVVHFINHWFTHDAGTRAVYQKWVFIIFITTGISLVYPLITMIILLVLLFAAPFMAVFYTFICYDEVYTKMQRPLAQLK